MSLTGPEIPAASGTTKQLIMFLHGWGADGENLISIGHPLSQLFPHAHFLAPNGPEMHEYGGPGYQWFSLMDRSPNAMLAGADAAASKLQSYIDAQLQRFGLDESQLALVGFSQGTMMALHAALRRAKPVAGIVGFSGTLVGAEHVKQHIRSKPPVCLIHGMLDSVVPFAALAHAKEYLSEAGVKVETHARPRLDHAIDEEGLTIAIRFLEKVLS
jgi:phospholipase/carboxylesterase